MNTVIPVSNPFHRPPANQRLTCGFDAALIYGNDIFAVLTFLGTLCFVVIKIQTYAVLFVFVDSQEWGECN